MARSPHDMEPEFERAWNERLTRAPHANFTFLPEFQRAEPERSWLVLVDTRRVEGALVLRQVGRELVCGAPWRSQAVVTGADPACPEGMTPAQAEVMFEAAQCLAGRHRLRFFSPFAHGSVGSHVAGRTVLIRLSGRSEDQLYGDLDRDKRRWVRKATREDLLLIDQPTVALLRQFAVILDETHVQRHGLPPAPPGETPPAGREWRSWEMPWHRILLALREGRVISGLGWGRHPRGMIDGRANASNDEGRRVGASILLVWESLRRAQAEGLAWANLCGSTRFKREFGGVEVAMHCRLGGGVEWLAPNVIEHLVRGEGRRAARVVVTSLARSWHALAGAAAAEPAGSAGRRAHIEDETSVPARPS